MRALLALLLITPLMANGWETSRFFIRVNGTRAGHAEVQQQVADGTVKTRSVSTITVKRAGTPLTVTEETTEISDRSGRPLSLQYRFRQVGMTLSLSVTFRDGRAVVTDETGTHTVPVPAGTVLGYGQERITAALVAAGPGEREITVFSPLARGATSRRLIYRGPKDTDHGRFHQVQVIDRMGEAELTQDTLVDENGQTVYTVNRIMGLTVETLPESWGTVTEDTASPDILIQTLSRSRWWFPSGFRTESLTLRLTGVAPTAIPETPFQKRVPVADGVQVTIVKPVVPAAARAGRNPAALRDGPIVQTSLDRIRSTAGKLRRQHPSDVAFAAAVMDWVYRFIERKNYGVGFDNTRGILTRRAGDCTEHTVLAMAMLRAGGIPARAAAGLVSINGTLGYHMWVEALLDDRWIPMDPTFNQKVADPSHLRLATSLLNDGSFQQDLLPVMEVVTRVKVTPLKAVVAGKAIDGFSVTAGKQKMKVVGRSFDFGEPIRWEAAAPGAVGTGRALGTATLTSDGTRVSVTLADAKSAAELDRLTGRFGGAFSPLSFETILGRRVALGWDGARFVMLTETGGAVFRFIFQCGSDTIGAACKERAYNICLKILSDDTRTDSDR